VNPMRSNHLADPASFRNLDDIDLITLDNMSGDLPWLHSVLCELQGLRKATEEGTSVQAQAIAKLQAKLAKLGATY
jgi:hypothetical protein